MQEIVAVTTRPIAPLFRTLDEAFAYGQATRAKENLERDTTSANGKQLARYSSTNRRSLELIFNDGSNITLTATPEGVEWQFGLAEASDEEGASPLGDMQINFSALPNVYTWKPSTFLNPRIGSTVHSINSWYDDVVLNFCGHPTLMFSCLFIVDSDDIMLFYSDP